MFDSPFLQEARRRMVAEQIEARGIRDPRLSEVMRRLPRHWFVQEAFWGMAYEDNPLPTGHGQTISQPYIVALMTSLLRLRGDETVLEIGTGSGYQAAILALLARRVVSIEYHPDLLQRAGRNLEWIGIDNVKLLSRDGSVGAPEFGPYQGILVTAAAPGVPPPLFEQLSLWGRLVLPVGGPGQQELQLWQASPVGFEMSVIAPVSFVPLRGKYGWKQEEWRDSNGGNG